MRSKATLFVSTGLFLSSFILTDPSLAAGKGKVQNTFLEAELDPVVGSPEPEAEGESDFRQQLHKGVVKQERFEVKVKIPIPSAGLGIPDAAAAQAADVRVLLSDAAATTYGVCFLQPVFY